MYVDLERMCMVLLKGGLYAAKIALFAITVILNPLATMNRRKAIHNPWLPKRGIKRNQEGKKTKSEAMIIVLRISLAAVAPM